MTREETVKIIRVIADTYPNWKPADMTSVVNTWHAQLQYDDFELVATALMAYNRSNNTGFAPSIGQLLNIVANRILADEQTELSEADAWAMAHKAIRNMRADSDDEFYKLPETVQKAIGAASVLRNWGLTPTDEISVVESNFKRAYRTVINRRKDDKNIMLLAGRINKLRAEKGLAPIIEMNGQIRIGANN